MDKLKTELVTTDQIGEYVDELINFSKNQRKSHERRWYDNNFFDDGYHYRYLQRSTGKIVDLSDKSSIYNPLRAIPKASRQIRGVANLLISNDPVPVVYPERVLKSRFNDENIYQEAIMIAKEAAKKRGFWLESEFKAQSIAEKLAFMIILAAKHSVSWIQVWPDSVQEAIRSQVYDAFDIYTMGNLTDPEDAPFIAKGVPRLISEIKADEKFDKAQLEKITPDNKRASSEIKEAYLSSRFGKESNPEATATLIQKEVYIKEYLNEINLSRIAKQDDASKILKNKQKGDLVIRQVFVAGNVWLRDRYVNLNNYPFIDLRLEPGQIYSVPLIERFIPSNKSLDAAVSRVERFMHTQTVGMWLKKASEQFKVNNTAGGQIVEYENIPPTQAQLAPMPAYVFNFMDFLNGMIEEQGVTTTTLGKVPQGVKAAAAIESLKESEYANLVIANRRLKRCVQTIAERMLEIADEYFVKPKEVEYLDKGKPAYFAVIGDSAYRERKKLKATQSVPEDVIPISKNVKVEVEVQSGSAFTREGKRELSKQLIDTMVQFTELGVIPPESLKVAVEKWLEDFGFGATSEFMDAWEEGIKQGTLTTANMDQIKVAVMEVMKDLINNGVLPTPEQRIEEAKVAQLEVIKDTGMLNKEEEAPTKPPSQSISFKDLPPEGKVQMAGQAGIQITPEAVQEQEEKQEKIKSKENEVKGGKNAAK